MGFEILLTKEKKTCEEQSQRKAQTNPNQHFPSKKRPPKESESSGLSSTTDSSSFSAKVSHPFLSVSPVHLMNVRPLLLHRHHPLMLDKLQDCELLLRACS